MLSECIVLLNDLAGQKEFERNFFGFRRDVVLAFALHRVLKREKRSRDTG